ncbi:MAG: PhoH family protein, partial [Verrucomicrobia bacterium]|nr:PhoH family protein [Verrucomicrobiota bacterium]
MASETLHFETARFAQQLFHNDPRNLKAVETQLNVKATSRDAWIKLEGETEPVERAWHLFRQLEASLKMGAAIGQRDFSSALEMVRTEGIAALQGLHDERIHTSQRKSTVLPKT